MNEEGAHKLLSRLHKARVFIFIFIFYTKNFMFYEAPSLIFTTLFVKKNGKNFIFPDFLFAGTVVPLKEVKSIVKSMQKESYGSARSVHSLHRPYENAEPAGIRLIAKRFLMAGCRTSSAG